MVVLIGHILVSGSNIKRGRKFDLSFKRQGRLDNSFYSFIFAKADLANQQHLSRQTWYQILFSIFAKADLANQ